MQRNGGWPLAGFYVVQLRLGLQSENAIANPVARPEPNAATGQQGPAFRTTLECIDTTAKECQLRLPAIPKHAQLGEPGMRACLPARRAGRSAVDSAVEQCAQRCVRSALFLTRWETSSTCNDLEQKLVSSIRGRFGTTPTIGSMANDDASTCPSSRVSEPLGRRGCSLRGRGIIRSAEPGGGRRR